MKISEVKAAVAKAAAENKEALGEVSKLVADLKKQIDDLVAGNSDPDVTDEQFSADLASLASDAASLAAIVPNPETPPVEAPTETPVGETTLP